MTDPKCAKCGHPRSNHPYRHPFVGPSKDDTIAELEAELHLMKTSGIVEVAVRNPNVMEYMKHWEGRAEAAETALAKAIDALQEIASLGRCDFAKVRATLAELKARFNE